MSPLKYILAAAAPILFLVGCTEYRTDLLQPSVELVRLNQRNAESVVDEVHSRPDVRDTHPYDPSDGLDESELVIIALTFNPDLRNRRYAMVKRESPDIFAGIRFNPEFRVSVRSVTAGFATDSESLYALLDPSERAARRNSDRAATTQARAEIRAAEWKLVAEVRRVHLTVRAADRRRILNEERLAELSSIAEQLDRDPQLGSDLVRSGMALAMAEARSDQRRISGELDAARRELNRLIGFNPEDMPVLSDLAKPLTEGDDAVREAAAIDAQVIAERWELKALAAAHTREDYALRQEVFRQYPRFKLAPALTWDRDEGTSFSLGAAMRIPLPNANEDEIANAETKVGQARANYLSAMHQMRSEAHGANERLRRALAELVAEDGELSAAAVRTVELSRLAFEKREISVFDYLGVLGQACAARRARLEAEVECRKARIDLEFATGTPDPYLQH